MTNMHVGNGDVNYNIIDNEVEKDPVTGYPTVNASGVKGALREFFNGDSELRQYVSTLFGADKAGDTTPGQLKVLCADMIARAARASSGKQASKRLWKLSAEAATLFTAPETSLPSAPLTQHRSRGLKFPVTSG